MTFYPIFPAAFACRASACRHSCCRGWEIDVDEAALRRYASVPGVLGEKLRSAICQDETGAHFQLTEDECCPFLRSDGLCELICWLGEEALCEICAAHPRFYTPVGEAEIAGYGLSCEAACALLLAEEAPLRFVSDETGEIVSVPSMLDRMGVSVSEHSLRFDGAPPSESYLERMALTEPIDERWPEEFSRLRAALIACPPLPTGGIYDRILQYIFLRQLDRADRVPIGALIDYARDSAAFVAAQDVLFGPDAEHLRRWSEQIEYSTENVEILLGIEREE